MIEERKKHLEQDRFYKYRNRARQRGDSDQKIDLDFQLNITPAIKRGQIELQKMIQEGTL